MAGVRSSSRVMGPRIQRRPRARRARQRLVCGGQLAVVEATHEGTSGTVVPLSENQAAAIAWEFYRDKVAANEDNPGPVGSDH